MNKSSHPFVQLLVMAAVSLVMMLAVAVIVAIVGFAAGLPAEDLPMVYLSQVLSQLLCFALPAVLMVYIYYRGSSREFYALRFEGRHWQAALASVVAMLLLTPLVDTLTVWNDGWHLPDGMAGLENAMRETQQKSEALMAGMMSGTGVDTLATNLLVVALLAAVVEELFFRVGLQNLLLRWWQPDGDSKAFGAHAAVWVSAAVFSLAHAELFAFVPRFVLGLLLGYAYLYGRSLLCNVLVHFVNNAIVVILYWLSARGTLGIDPAEPFNFGAGLVVCCSLAAVVLMYVAVYRSDKA